MKIYKSWKTNGAVIETEPDSEGMSEVIAYFEYDSFSDGISTLTGAEAEENARLAAAAPKLLFACMQALLSFDTGYYGPKIKDDLVDAIAEAIGESDEFWQQYEGVGK